MKINESKKRLVLESCSEDFIFHYKNQIPISENIFRPGSKKFFSLFNEARFYYEQNLIDLNDQDYNFVVEHDLGKFGYYEGQLVPLDFPILVEAKYKGREVTLGAKGAQRAGGGKSESLCKRSKNWKSQNQ